MGAKRRVGTRADRFGEELQRGFRAQVAVTELQQQLVDRLQLHEGGGGGQRRGEQRGVLAQSFRGTRQLASHSQAEIEFELAPRRGWGEFVGIGKA